MTNENATENLVGADLAVQEIVELASTDTPVDGADAGAVYFQTEAEIGDEKEVIVA